MKLGRLSIRWRFRIFCYNFSGIFSASFFSGKVTTLHFGIKPFWNQRFGSEVSWPIRHRCRNVSNHFGTGTEMSTHFGVRTRLNGNNWDQRACVFIDMPMLDRKHSQWIINVNGKPQWPLTGAVPIYWKIDISYRWYQYIVSVKYTLNFLIYWWFFWYIVSYRQ